MFRHAFNQQEGPDGPAAPDGRFCWIAQKLLVFGSNAKVPRRRRPVMLVRDRLGPVAPVIPCTTRGKGKTTSSFYRLDWAAWIGQEPKLLSPTWLYGRAESVQRSHLGVWLNVELPPNELEKIRRWLRGESET